MLVVAQAVEIIAAHFVITDVGVGVCVCMCVWV